MDFQGVAREAIRLLGEANAAHVAGVGETRAVREWAMGEREPRDPLVVDRLRLAIQVAYMIEPFDSVGVIQAWFRGMNPRLENRQPREVIRKDELRRSGPHVISAARAFIAHG